MLFLLPWPNMKGHLPVLTEFVVKDVYFDEAAAAAGNVMAFDVGLVAATTYDIGTESSGVTTSAWGRVRVPDVSASTQPNAGIYVYGVAVAATTAATFGDVLVIGNCTLVKVASANHAAGQPFVPAQASVHKVAVCNQLPATSLVATGELRKIVALARTAGTSTTALSAWFNGFGIGYFMTNVAYAADS